MRNPAGQRGEVEAGFAGWGSLAAWLAPANRQRLFNRVTGGVFIAFGVALLGGRA